MSRKRISADEIARLQEEAARNRTERERAEQIKVIAEARFDTLRDLWRRTAELLSVELDRAPSDDEIDPDGALRRIGDESLWSILRPDLCEPDEVAKVAAAAGWPAADIARAIIGDANATSDDMRDSAARQRARRARAGAERQTNGVDYTTHLAALEGDDMHARKMALTLGWSVRNACALWFKVAPPPLARNAEAEHAALLIVQEQSASLAEARRSRDDVVRCLEETAMPAITGSVSAEGARYVLELANARVERLAACGREQLRRWICRLAPVLCAALPLTVAEARRLIDASRTPDLAQTMASLTSVLEAHSPIPPSIVPLLRDIESFREAMESSIRESERVIRDCEREAREACVCGGQASGR